MKTQTTKLLSLSLFLASGFSVAASSQSTALHVAELKVKTTQVIDAKSGTSHTRYEVDGIDISLTREDEVKAKNWNLTPTDWVKYKYAMEFTPRGTWSPDLDPPIVLGNLAKTEAERVKYGRIMNTLELDRRSREIAFQLSAISALPKEDKKTTEPTSALSQALPANKSILKSIFIDTATCDNKCNQFVLMEVAGTSNRTKLNIIFTTEDQTKQQTILNNSGLNADKVKSKDVSITTNQELSTKYKGNNTYPFLIIQNDEGVTRRDTRS